MIIDFSNINGGGGGGGYILPIASSEVLGGVKIGSGVTIDSGGTIATDMSVLSGYVQTSAMSGYVGQEQYATTERSGVVKIGSGITVDSAGTISVDNQGGGKAEALQSVSTLPSGATSGDVMSNATIVRVGDAGNVYHNDEIQTSTFVVSDNDQFYFVKLNDVQSPVTLFSIEDYGNYTPIILKPNGHYAYVIGDQETEITEDTSVAPYGARYYFNLDGDNLECYINESKSIVNPYVYSPKTDFNGELYVYAPSGTSRAYVEKMSIKDNFKNSFFTWYGELPTNTPLFSIVYDQNLTYYGAYDGQKMNFYSDSGLTNLDKSLYKGKDDIFVNESSIMSWKDNVITWMTNHDWSGSISLVGSWYITNSGHYQPINWTEHCKSISRYGITTQKCTVYLGSDWGDRKIYIPSYSNDSIEIICPSSHGNDGQFLISKGSYDAPIWTDLNITEYVNMANDLPMVADENSICIVNSGYSAHSTTAFLAKNSTSSSDKNNFSNNDELNWYDWGNNYIYFGNGSYSGSGKTFLYRIAMRTDENGDWATSKLAYLNVWKEGNAFKWELPPFRYNDSQGEPYTYSTSGEVDSNTTSADTIYLPLWRWWDGSYGYKFHFEIDGNGNLTMYMRDGGVDESSDGYGSMPVKVFDHTEKFYNMDALSQTSEMYFRKGGAWTLICSLS